MSVCHRDLNPNNVMITKKDPSDSNSDLMVKLIDFNVSRKFRGRNFLKSSDDSPVSKLILMMTQTGAPGFSAPEVLNGTSYNESVDMWGVGCLLFLCLFGRAPFSQNE